MEKSMINILVCEDEEDLRGLLKIHLENEGFSVHESKNGLEALDFIRSNSVHLLLLDVMMPFKNGFEVIRELRSMGNHIPIIMLTARVEYDNKVLGLDLGADDYICKPFNYREVLSRVNSHLRRYFDFSSTSKKVYKNGVFKMNLDDFVLYKNDEVIELNPKEFKILEVFMSNPGRVFTKEQIYEKAWKCNYLNDDNTLMVHISKIREKLNDEDNNYIQTIRNLGYRMRKIES